MPYINIGLVQRNSILNLPLIVPLMATVTGYVVLSARWSFILF